MFNEINSCRVSEEYREGGSAYFSGISNNPYPKGLQYEEWEWGWCDAQGYDQYSRGGIDFNVD